MTIWESIRLAFRSLRANKLRATLTMLGIIFGVAAVVALLSIGRGFEKQVTSQIESNGSNLIYVFSAPTQERGRAPSKPFTLTLGDAEALQNRTRAPAILAVSPEMNAGASVSYQGQIVSPNIVGVTDAYPIVHNTRLARGDWISDGDVAGRQGVCVLGATTAADLFGAADPIGKTIRLDAVPCRVIGVAAKEGRTSFGDADNAIYMPITTVSSRLIGFGQVRGDSGVSVIMVKARGAREVQAAAEQLTLILRERHNITGVDDFRLSTQEQLLRSVQSITGIITLFLGSIAAISLLVGGIGIMNIMLVSVTERTHEIGIRKAVGAKRWHILVQFLIEAIVLAILGGSVGLLFAFGIGQLIALVTAQTETPLIPVFDLQAVILATTFSTIVGLVFGVYPAYRAARLHPIDALRYE